MKTRNSALRVLCAVLCAPLCLTALAAAPAETIPLAPPDLNRPAPLMRALADRRSIRDFDPAPLSKQELSDLLWAANGINRPDGRRTAPTARNKQDIDLYVLHPDAAYLHDASAPALKLVATGDLRPLAAGAQSAVANAPVILLLVSDFERFGNSPEFNKQRWAALDAGNVSQNICLFAAAAGLATVPRTTQLADRLKSALKLRPAQQPLLNHPVGHPKKAPAN
ncbi:MAG: SagB/ThcOx family dehydrogenase [Opitutaceae bacterium]|nr:SagB/ThcOx family dehydrogenase [Opitutaceae bacterium]